MLVSNVCVVCIFIMFVVDAIADHRVEAHLLHLVDERIRMVLDALADMLSSEFMIECETFFRRGGPV